MYLNCSIYKKHKIMNNEHTDDTFLARWLNNDLTKEELLEFQKTETYKDYVKINKAVGYFEGPNFNKEKVFDALQSKVKNQPKVKKLVPNWMYAAAASIAILFSFVYFLTNSNESFTTSFGEQMAIVLPDGSEVQLNSKSSLSYKKSDWFDGERTLELKGEGYFKVKKGSKFSVNSENGKVSVLGTQFNVKTLGSYFEVLCYEGKVQVENKDTKEILTQGLSFRKIDKNISEKGSFNASKPLWLIGESSFKNVPLNFVLDEIEKQYNVKINNKNVNLSMLYTGTFSNNQLDLALQTICVPLSIQFVVNNNTVTISKK